MELTQEQLDKLAELTFTRGSHKDQLGTCWMEALALTLGYDWTDRPPCTPYEASNIAQHVNDGPWPDDETRTRELRARTPYLLRIERGIEATQKRAFQAAQIAREIAVEALKWCGIDVAVLEALPVITDLESAVAVEAELRRNASAVSSSAVHAIANAIHAADVARDAHYSAADAAYNAATTAYLAAARSNIARRQALLRILDAWIGYPG